MLTGGFLSWYASELPDGLEWSLARVTGTAEPEGPDAGAHKTAADLQQRTAVLPDYALPGEAGGGRGGTTLSGLLGSLLVLLLTGGGAALLRSRSRKQAGVSRHTP